MIETAVFATSPVQLSVCSRQRMTQRAAHISTLSRRRARRGTRQRERDVLTRVIATTDGHDDVLLPVDHVSHGRTTLRCRQEDGANLLPGLLVVGCLLYTSPSPRDS